MADESNPTSAEPNAVTSGKPAKKVTRKRKTTRKKATAKTATVTEKATDDDTASPTPAAAKKTAAATAKKKTRRTTKRVKRTPPTEAPQVDAAKADNATAVAAPEQPSAQATDAITSTAAPGPSGSPSGPETGKSESKPVGMKTRRKRTSRRTTKDPATSETPSSAEATPGDRTNDVAPAPVAKRTETPAASERPSGPSEARPAPARATTDIKALPAPSPRPALPERNQPFGFGIAPTNAPAKPAPASRPSTPPPSGAGSAPTDRTAGPAAPSGAAPSTPVARHTPPGASDGSPSPQSSSTASAATGETSGKPKRKRRRKSHAQRRREQAARQLNGTAEESANSAPADASAPAPEKPATVDEHTAAGEAAAAHDDDGTPRIVLKPRPPRRARGKRRRGGKQSPEQRSDTAEVRSEEETGLAPEGDGAAPDAAPPDSSAREVSDADVLDDSAGDEATDNSINRIEIIDESDPAPRALAEGREMIINVTAGAECRIAILENQRLEELSMERQSAASHVGNIYMGRITNVEPSIQAAFVDFGLAKNGFLHISDVLPKYFPNSKNELEQVGKKVPRRDRPPIQKCFRRGDKVIVQVVKEGVGTKGPTLTTYLSIPGRFMVMMPGMDRLGVSRKIEDETDRRAMRDILNQLSLPNSMGFILRTAGLNRNKRELQSDLNYLNRLWKTVEQRINRSSTPCELYQESDLVIRTIRDVYSSDFKRIVVDDADTARKASEFLRIAMPRTPNLVIEYRRPEPIFHCFGIEQEIERIHSRHVPLPSGGSIVIDSTEAMVAIDVNSGKFRELHDAEETAFHINLEAAEEIARHLRLRDLGGLVVCDFIDMRMDRHKRAVEKALRDALKKHKERARILRMSKFGLIEMTRQRQRQSLKRSIFVDCPQCRGGGLVKTPESMSLEVIRVLQLLVHRKEVTRITASAAPPVAALILNDHRAYLYRLEEKSGKRITISPNPLFTRDQVEYECTDDRGMPLRVDI